MKFMALREIRRHQVYRLERAHKYTVIQFLRRALRIRRSG